MLFTFVTFLVVAAAIPPSPTYAAPAQNETEIQQNSSTVNYTDVPQLTLNVTDETATPSIQCHCNLPACLDAAGKSKFCVSRVGCFLQLPVGFIGNFSFNGTYGCQEFLPVNATCDSSKKTEKRNSIFEMISSALPLIVFRKVDAYHCCNHDQCNDQNKVENTAINNMTPAVNATARTNTEFVNSTSTINSTLNRENIVAFIIRVEQLMDSDLTKEIVHTTERDFLSDSLKKRRHVKTEESVMPPDEPEIVLQDTVLKWQKTKPNRKTRSVTSEKPTILQKADWDKSIDIRVRIPGCCG